MTQARKPIIVEFGKTSLQLLPDRAVYWPAREMLIVADVHLGKSAAFRSAGVPVPSGATAKDLSRLDVLLRDTRASRLTILGDFFHSRLGRDDAMHQAIGRWREQHARLPIMLVRGNHDRASGALLAEWDIQEVEEPFDAGPIALGHDPARKNGQPALCGHIHPVCRLQDFDGSGVSVPCFVFDRDCGILPAFGSFTGGGRFDPTPPRRVYIAAGGRVVPLPG